eukprot:UN18648
MLPILETFYSEIRQNVESSICSSQANFRKQLQA